MVKKVAIAEEQLFESASSGDTLVLSYLLKVQGVGPDLRDQYGTTPLMEACRFGRAKCVRLLVDAGAAVNAADKEKMTVLMYACTGASSSKVVAFLISKGSKVNERDAYGCTALMRAASRGAVPIVSTLLENGAYVDEESNNHETPLTFAIVWNHIEVVQQLIDANANLNWCDKEGWTPLQYALYENNKGLATLLQDHGASLSPAPLPIGKRVANQQDRQQHRKKK
jgi:uncharacterized protein